MDEVKGVEITQETAKGGVHASFTASGAKYDNQLRMSHDSNAANLNLVQSIQNNDFKNLEGVRHRINQLDTNGAA